MRQSIIIFLLFILIGNGIPEFTDAASENVNNSGNQNIGGVIADGNCKASTVEGLSQCIVQLNSGSVSSIEVTSKIFCNETSQCRFTITTTKGGSIVGTPGSGAGFFRSGNYTKEVFGAPIFRVSGASNITLSNLSFNDDINSANQPYCIVTSSNDCIWPNTATNPTSRAFWDTPLTFPFITVENANTIIFTQLLLTNGKRDQISIQKSTNISIVNSRIENGYLRGVSLVAVDGGRFEGNYVSNNGGAGLVADKLKNYTIKNNFFINNQTYPPWVIGGGQINADSENVIISGNTFMRTVIPIPFKGSSFGGGIELHTSNANMTIRDNNFIDKVGNFIVGPAIYNDPYANATNTTTSTYNNVFIDNNRMDTEIDGTCRGAICDMTNVNTWKLGTNCFNSIFGCPIDALGTLSISPNPCSIENGKNTCAISISWFANFATNVEVKTGEAIIARGMNGNIVFNDISATAVPITVWGNGIQLAFVNAIGTLPKVNVIPSPSPKPKTLFFQRNLGIGSRGSDVMQLQSFLIRQNAGSFTQKLAALKNVTYYFGFFTKESLREFQKKIGIEPASGYFGPITRARVNELMPR